MIPIGLDCEWQVGRPGLQAPPLACVTVGTSEHQTVFHHTDWVDTVATLLEDSEILIIGHYIASDFVVLCNEAPGLFPLVFDAYEANRIACTLCRQKLCDIAGGIYRKFEDIDGETTKLFYGLDDVSLRLLNRTLDKNTWRLRYGELIPVPLAQWPEGAILYPKEDVRATVDVWKAQEKNAYYLEDQFRQARASFWIRLMATWGIRTDEAGIRALAERTSTEYNRIEAALKGAGLIWGAKPAGAKKWGALGARNTKAAQDRVTAAYQRLGREVPLTDGGKRGIKNPCTDRVTCEESGDKILIEYASLSSLKKVLTTDIPLLRGGIITPIHSLFEDIKESGRTGSAKPNIQNVKRKGGIRECFVPRCLKCSRVHTAEDVGAGRCLRCGGPVSVMWSCDYGGLELCTLAQTCMTVLEESRLAEALNNDIDAHMMIAEQILNRPYAELKAIKKHGAGLNCQASKGNKGCHCDYCIVVDARQTGKVANFGFMGGLGPAALVFFALNNYDVHLTEDEARRLKRVWLETWPEMRKYFAWISTYTDKPFPQIVQLFSNRFRGGVRFTEAANTFPQGMGADIAKAAGWEIFRAMYDRTRGSILFGSRGCNFVHDEFLGESPEHIGHECAFEVRRLMLEAAKPWLPDVKIDVEPALMRRYSKDAGPKYEKGRLIPWAA